MGQTSTYKKRYASITGSTISLVIPITTAIIQVNNGVVQSTYWDDGCYWCGSSGANQQSAENVEQCVPNAFNLTTNLRYTVNSNAENSPGNDCAFSPVVNLVALNDPRIIIREYVSAVGVATIIYRSFTIMQTYVGFPMVTKFEFPLG